MAKWYDNRFVSMLDSKTQMKIRNALECKGYKGSALLHAMVARVNDLAGTIDIAKIMGYGKNDVCVIVGPEKRWT